jgi:hypothetical protein
MTINVTQVTKKFNVRIQKPNQFKVGVKAEASSVAGNLTDLGDFNPTGVQDKYLIMYDATTQKYITVDPDVVLSSSLTTNQGLPQDFINQLDVDLDNKIDLDAGTF